MLHACVSFVQSLPPDEVKDLNRGRAYLANVADRHDVTVYQSLEVALQEAYALIQQQRADRDCHFVVDDDGDIIDASDSDVPGTEPSSSLRHNDAAKPLAHEEHTLSQAPPRPSITSALADLASQFVEEGYGVDDAISEDDEDSDRGEDDDDASAVAGGSARKEGAPAET